MGFFLKRLFSLDPLKGGPRAREKNAREAMEKKTQNCGGVLFVSSSEVRCGAEPVGVAAPHFWGPQVWSLFWFREIAENLGIPGDSK